MVAYFKEVWLLDKFMNIIWLFKSNPKVGSSYTTTPLPHPHQKKRKEKKERKEERKQSISTPKRIRSFAFKCLNNSSDHSERPIWSCDFPILCILIFK